MPRINPIDPSTATGDAATHLATVRKMLGGTPNLFTTAAHSPAALGALLGMITNLGKGVLGGKTGELIAVTVANANRCGYCLAAHTALGLGAGLSASALQSARHAQADDVKTTAVLTLAAAINQSRGQIDDATLTAARAAGVTDAEIVEVVAAVAANVFTNYLNNVARTTIDFPEIPLTAAA